MQRAQLGKKSRPLDLTKAVPNTLKSRACVSSLDRDLLACHGAKEHQNSRAHERFVVDTLLVVNGH